MTPSVSVVTGFDFPECVQELRKAEFCEGRLNYSCPLTRVSVRIASTVIAFVRTHLYLGVPVVQCHKFSRFSAEKLDSFRLEFVSGDESGSVINDYL